jgi:hypothetical protein
VTVLHLRCGDDLRERLPAAGIAGDDQAFADPVCMGPGWDDGDLAGWISRRARYLALHAGIEAGAARQRLAAEYAALEGLGRCDAVRLWFEHDLWDQAALIRVLSLLAGQAAPASRLWRMPADGWRCFAELADAELAALVPVPLSAAELACGAEAWRAFSDPDPTALDSLYRRDLPWTTDGLALTERLALQAVAAGATDLAAVHRALRAADPVFHVTDLIVAEVLARLSEGPRRLLARGAALALSDRGRAVLVGEARHVPTPRALGGVPLGPDRPWRWDPEAGAARRA